jgi:acyl-CoA synthetase (AMP-forming)/AMP-acid ligase II
VSALPWPEGTEDPRADRIWGTIPALVAGAADRYGPAEALVDGDRRLTFAQLAPEVQRWSRAFLAAGLAPGEAVALWAPNSVDWALAALGAVSAGGVLVTVNTRFRGAEAAHILRASGARLLVSAGDFLGTDYPALLADQDAGDLGRLVVLGPPGTGSGPAGVAAQDQAEFLAAGQAVGPDEAAARAAAVRPDDPADLLFTSGTTGGPKGVPATHAQGLRTFGTWAAIVGLRPGDRYLVVNPFFHTFGYKAGLLASLMAGATVVPEAVFDPEAVRARIAAEHISVLPGPPTLYQSLLAPGPAPADLSSLRLGVTGAAVVPVELVEAMGTELGFDTVLTAYGLTESCGTVTMCRRGDPPELVATTSGRAIPGLEVQVVDGRGAPRPPGEPGEVVVRGYTVFPGYVGDQAATAEALDAEGWLHTGDIGVMDARGYLTITDRLKDMFVVGGFNAYPAEIEAMLRPCPGVGQVAVVGVPDERLGEVGCAYLVPAAGAGPEVARALLDFARGAMANYKVPRYAVVLDALPLNASGKILKRELRERFARGADPVVARERSS